MESVLPTGAEQFHRSAQWRDLRFVDTGTIATSRKPQVPRLRASHFAQNDTSVVGVDVLIKRGMKQAKLLLHLPARSDFVRGILLFEPLVQWGEVLEHGAGVEVVGAGHCF
jgi:hypothetical protein